MDKNKICEAMYALPGAVVVRRRKPLLTPFLLLVGGVIVLLPLFTGRPALTADLHSAALLVGALLALCGLVLLLARLFDRTGVPYYTAGRCRLRYEELRFGRGVRETVAARVDAGDLAGLDALPRAQVPEIAVALYRSPDGRFVAMQAFEYVDLEYRPLTGLRVCRAGE